MTMWRPQSYQRRGKELGIEETLLARACAIGSAVIAVNPALPPVFTLRHLAYQVDADYGLLRAIISRSLRDPYKVFRIRKRPSTVGEKRFRVICVPDPELMRVQRWISQRILSHANPHSASVAYAKGSTILAGAEPHCGCRWLIKLDVRNFFETISEIAVYRVFRSLGYQALVAFELTRLCTRLGTKTPLRIGQRWQVHFGRHMVIGDYSASRMGHLPQGAPTSPMLANLAVLAFDGEVNEIANKHGLIYTRYADDIALSTTDKTFSRTVAAKVIGEVYAAMGRYGLSPNVTKTRVSSPASRKVVLGLLVDGNAPRLTREFKANLRRHLHYLGRPDVGPAKHAAARGFAAIAGLRHHVEGLVAFARQIEPEYGERSAKLLVDRL
ncbi:MAG: RNA-directed DNA polymerase [Rhodospirillales bacterium]|nr:RNA-directed DNA polymerase [Rhodospirillales bacterium]